jgi:hypothetical protein
VASGWWPPSATPGGSARPPTARSSGPSWAPTATSPRPPPGRPTCATPRPPRRRFRGQRDSYRDVVAAAQARGDATVELTTTATPAAASGARGYLALLEQADALCRDGTLLTPEPLAGVKALRRWFVEETAAQVEGAAPTPPDVSG